MESALMMMPPVRSASESASADLPLAVGPAISTASVASPFAPPRSSPSMSLVATLICNPVNPALDSTVLDGARAILSNAGPTRWLWDEVAADIPFESDEPIPTITQRLREARGDLPIDVVIQPQLGRRKKLFL